MTALDRLYHMTFPNGCLLNTLKCRLTALLHCQSVGKNTIQYAIVCLEQFPLLLKYY